MKRQIAFCVAVSLLAVIIAFSFAVASEEHGKGHSHWAAPAKESARRNPVAGNKASIERGEELYRTHCSSCHGKQGKGDGPAGAGLEPRPTDLSHVSGHHADAELAWKIETGRGAMPGFKNVLTEAGTWDIVNYVKSLYSAGSQGMHGEGH